MGYDQHKLEIFIFRNGTFKDFFELAEIHKNTYIIKGIVFVYCIENIPGELTLFSNCRRMEKLIDEFANEKVENILRR